MPNSPKISVILTSLNHEKFIGQAIESVLNQTFGDFELFIIDDHSNDRSWDVICSYHDSRIIPIRNQKRRKAGPGVNETIANRARGEYICIHHSDDIYHPEKLEKQLKFLQENKNYAATFCIPNIIDENGNQYASNPNHTYLRIFNQKNRSREEWLHHFFYYGNCLCHPSIMARKSAYDSIGLYNERMGALPDFDMWVRFCKHHEIHIDREPLFSFRLLDNHGNISAPKPENIRRYAWDYSHILENYLDLDKDSLYRIFHREISALGTVDHLSPRIILSFLALTTPSSSHQLFGINQIYRALGEGDASLSSLDYMEISGLVDITKLGNQQNINLKKYCKSPFVSDIKGANGPTFPTPTVREANIQIRQIFYSPESGKLCDPAFLLLDNSQNERPDWREYWPIRNFLLTTPLQEDCYYGFFAPKFRQKTGLTASNVRQFIEHAPGTPDVIGFSPYPDQAVLFWNAFYQGEKSQGKLIETSQKVFDALGLAIDLYTLPGSCRNTIFANYFVANSRFWEAWLLVNEAIFALAEDSEHPLAAELNQEVVYLGQPSVPLKVFLMERVASVLLATYPDWKVVNYPPLALPTSPSFPKERLPLLEKIEQLKARLAERPSLEAVCLFHQTVSDLEAGLPIEAAIEASQANAVRISFIICSIDDKKFAAISQRLDHIVGHSHEIIRIPDARSLSEGYMRGFARSRGEIVVFCHDDIDILSGDQFAERLLAHLSTHDVVGVAGSTKLAGPFWMSSGPTTWAGQVIHHLSDTYDITPFDSLPARIVDVQALDGVFIATHRRVVNEVRFDAETFDGFHGYDVDFTYRCHLRGFRLGASKDLFLVHTSGGNFGQDWRKFAAKFIAKFPEFADCPLDQTIRYSPCSIRTASPSAAERVCNELLGGAINPANHKGDAKAAWGAELDYQTWLTRKSLQEIDGQLLAERMMLAWKTRPLINIVLEVRIGEGDLLADTLDTLGAQWYQDWRLTIFAEFPPLSDELAAIPQISWITTPTGGFTAAFNQHVKQLPGDWLCLLEPGCTLEAHALAYFADAINTSPAPRLIYCDEDQKNTAGAPTNPRFKSDYNLEMLRSMYYLGPCLLLDKGALLASGELEFDGAAAFYDTALKFAEMFGAQGCYHLPEILLHTPATSLRDIDSASELQAVRNHFARQGIAAAVDSGFLSGTQAIVYPPQGNPKVSIIIPTRDQPGYLQHCVDSLLAETGYRNFELVIVDHGSTDPDALDFIGNLSERADLHGQVACVRTDGPFNWARLANLGAEQASGDLLLFLDNDTEIIQAAWLANLVGLVQLPGMAAVAPRLSCPDGQFSKLNQLPKILGLGGLSGPLAQEGLSILEPGYCGRLQITQEISALPGSCLLVKKEDFVAAGCFDELNTPIYEAALGLSLRLRRNGRKLAWTPWVDVVHRGGISRKRMEGDLNERGRLTDTALRERDHLLKEHLGELAADPYYHRQLSLLQPFAIEPHAVIDWDTRYHSRLRVLGAPLTSGSGEYRMLAPFRALQKEGLAQCCQVHPMGHKTQRVINPIELARAAPDVLMLQQAIDDTQIAQLKRYRQFNPEIFITYAVDDVMGNLPRKHYLYNFQAREGKSRMREGLAHCDRLIVSTEPLADYCRNMIDDIVVVPNRLEKERWLGLQSNRRISARPRVGWAGAQQHLGDLELIQHVVEALKDEVDWVFMGMCPPFLKPFIKEEHAFVPFANYPAKLASLNLDLAIAPLEQHLFNEGKSNLRLLEYGIMGWPVVCTDIYPYQTNNPPVKRVNNQAAEWIAAIRERINDLDGAAREGELLRQWVHKHYLLEDHLDQWLAAVTPTGWKNG